MKNILTSYKLCLAQFQALGDINSLSDLLLHLCYWNDKKVCQGHLLTSDTCVNEGVKIPYESLFFNM